MSFTEDIRKQEEEYTRKHKALSDSCWAAINAGNRDLADSIMATPAYATLLRDLKTIFRNTDNYIRDVILTNKDTEWGPLLMLVTVNWYENKHKEWFATFSPEAQKSYYGQILYDELYPRTLEGKAAPAFAFTDANGHVVYMQKLLAGKKYLLVDFWASWCDPCRREIPNLKKLYEQFAPKGLEVVSISIDKDEEDWKEALEEEQLSWPNFLDTSGVREAYGVRAIPAIFLVNATTGIVVGVDLQGEALAQKIAELLP